MIVDGQPVALHGSSLACGCKVLSARQMSTFVSHESGASAPTARSMPTAFTSAAAAAPAPTSALDYPGTARDANTRSEADWETARNVITDSHNALMEAGAYRDYDTELEAARVWRQHVLPVANSELYGVEVGAVIAKMPNGKYRFGAPWSSGEQARVRDLVGQAPRPASATEVTASIHTHPRAGGLPGGGDRAFVLDQFPDA